MYPGLQYRLEELHRAAAACEGAAHDVRGARLVHDLDAVARAMPGSRSVHLAAGLNERWHGEQAAWSHEAQTFARRVRDAAAAYTRVEDDGVRAFSALQPR